MAQIGQLLRYLCQYASIICLFSAYCNVYLWSIIGDVIGIISIQALSGRVGWINCSTLKDGFVVFAIVNFEYSQNNSQLLQKCLHIFVYFDYFLYLCAPFYKWHVIH